MPDSAKISGPFTLPPLPYAEAALAPAISWRTLAFHHGQHHKAYVEKTNELVCGTAFAEMKLGDIVKKTAGDPSHTMLSHHAAQAWNHAFYWNSLSPKASEPSGALCNAIAHDFGDLETLKIAFAKTAIDHFASGWAWLVFKDKKLAIVGSPDADTPMVQGATCLLALDVWEHAYYLDYQNNRKAHVQSVIDNLLNWTSASAAFDKM